MQLILYKAKDDIRKVVINMNKIIKIAIILMLLFICISQINISYGFSFSNVIESSNNFINKGQSPPQSSGSEGGTIINSTLTVNEGDLQRSSAEIYNTLLAIGVVLTVGVGGYLGIKFMVAGAAEDKAEIKQLLVPYIIGCIVIYGAFLIWKIVTISFNSLQ